MAFKTKPANELVVGDSIHIYRDHDYVDVTIDEISETESGVEVVVHSTGLNGGYQERVLLPRYHSIKLSA